jgi:hypothetical protein
MSFNLINILLIILILLILNHIKIKNKDELKNTSNNIPNIIHNKIPTYGTIQYEANNNYNNIDYNYDNIVVLDNYNKLTEKLSDLGPKSKPVYNEAFKKSNNSKNKFNNFELEDPELLPSQQNIIYDTYKQFNQMSDANIHNSLVPHQIDYADRKIQDVYDQLINDPKKYEKEKKIIKTEQKINGGFKGEQVLSNLNWEYENESDGMSYDPNLSNLMSINDINDIN